jgi:hypothetical protein
MKYKENYTNEANMLKAFGQEARDRTIGEEILNAGVIAGKGASVSKLCRAIYSKSKEDLRLVTFTPKYEDMLADQSAMNLVVREPEWIDVVLVASESAGFVSEFHHKQPREVRDGVMYPKGSDVPFCIWHQYCVNGDWWVEVKEKYDERRTSGSK